MLSLEDELTKAKLRIDTINLARDGEESEDSKLKGGVLFYLENKSKIKKLDDLLKELNQVVKWFEEKEKLNNKSNDNDENLKIQQNKLDKVLKIEEQFERFLSIQREIDSINKNIAEYKDILLKTEHEKLIVEKDKNDTLIKLNEIKASQENNRLKLNNIPTQQKDLEITSQIVSNTQKTIENLSKSIDTEEKKKNDLKIILDEFRYYENKISDDIEILSEFKLFDENKELINNYILKEIKLEKLKKDFQEIQFKINDQNQLNKEINRFVNSGLELINKSKSSDCPLCNYKYNSFEELSKNILTNTLLDSQSQAFLKEKALKELEINNLTSKLSIDREKIEKNFFKTKQPYLSSYKNTENVIEKLSSERKTNFEKLNKSQSVLNDINLLLGDSKTFDELSIKIQNDLSKKDEYIQHDNSDEIKESLENQKINLKKETVL